MSTEIEPTTADNIEPSVQVRKKKRSRPTTANKDKHNDLMVNSPI